MLSRKVIIIHPEGNLHQNPFMASLLCILLKKYSVEYRCAFRDIKIKEVKIKKANSSFYRLKQKLISIFPLILYPLNLIKKVLRENDADIIVSVDREGIIESYLINTKPTCKRIHISFEIMFAQETSARFKKAEIIALKQAQSIIIQDEVRADLFCEENKIDKKKMCIIPIVYLRNEKSSKLRVRDFVKIPKEHRVILWQGSLREWNGIDKLNGLVKNLPKGYSILMHGRDKHEMERFKNLFPNYKNLYISNLEFDDVLNMASLFSGISWGVVFYNSISSTLTM